LEGKVNGEFRIRKNITEPGMASIFANYPAPYSSASIGLVEEACKNKCTYSSIIIIFSMTECYLSAQILSTMIFMLVICVVTDKRYSNVPNFLQPLYIGFALLAIGVAYGSNGGYALNPVRKALGIFFHS